MEPSLIPMLQLYKVPNYVHGGNIPGSHYRTMHIGTGDELEKVPDHLADVRVPMQVARETAEAVVMSPSQSSMIG